MPIVPKPHAQARMNLHSMLVDQMLVEPAHTAASAAAEQT
jgi:hypothetical protein